MSHIHDENCNCCHHDEMEDDESLGACADVEFLDPEDSIFSLTDSAGEVVKFAAIACIREGEDFFMLMQPVDGLEEIESDEGIIFKIEPVEEKKEYFSLVQVDDQALLDTVFNKYLNAVAELESMPDDEEE